MGFLNGRRRIACFVGLHVLLLIGLIAAFSSVIIEYVSASARQVAAAQRAFERMQWALSHDAEVKREGHEADRLLEAIFLGGETTNAQSAALSLRLQDYCQKGRVALESITILQPREGRNARFVSARVEVHGSSEDLAAMIDKIESGWPFMVVEAATLKPTAGDDAGEKISATLDILGAVGWAEK